MCDKIEEKNKDDKFPAKGAILPEQIAITAVRQIKFDPYTASCIDSKELLGEIFKQADEINKGDLSQIERFLYAQAIALDAMFDRMLAQMGGSDFTPQVQLFGQLALKAQAQCRATLATLAQIKSPDQITFIKQLIQQQNNAIQVNNAGTQPTETKKIEKLANELLSEVSHATLEQGRSKEAISTDPEMASLEKVYRS